VSLLLGHRELLGRGDFFNFALVTLPRCWQLSLHTKEYCRRSNQSNTGTGAEYIVHAHHFLHQSYGLSITTQDSDLLKAKITEKRQRFEGIPNLWHQLSPSLLISVHARFEPRQCCSLRELDWLLQSLPFWLKDQSVKEPLAHHTLPLRLPTTFPVGVL
jgi:hypothetical protein